MKYYKLTCGGGIPVVELSTEDYIQLPDWAKKLENMASRIRYSGYYYRSKYRHLISALRAEFCNNPQQFKVYDKIMKMAKKLEEQEDKLAAPILKDCDESFKNLLINGVKGNIKEGKEVITMAKCCGGKKSSCKGSKGGKKGCK